MADKREESPFFSLVIPVLGARHLLPLTLETLKAQKGVPFEVILLDPEPSGKCLELIVAYPELNIQILTPSSQTLGALFHLGLKTARGKYIQFLEPGEKYLSQQGLSYLLELIQESEQPPFVYSGYLLKNGEASSQAVSFPLNRQILWKGVPLYAMWFSKKRVEELGGFDERLGSRPVFDLICRFFQNKKDLAVYSRRVLTDAEPKKASFSEKRRFVQESFRILVRHFGIAQALRWLLFQDLSQLAKGMWRCFKQAFGKV